MRIATIAAMVTVATTTGAIPAHAGAPDRKVSVCLDYDAGFAMTQLAEAVASHIYRKIGVSIEWHSAHCSAESIRIKLQFDTPENMKPGALAYALPYEGTHIVVFYDRISTNTCSDQAVASLFGHVLAHEIAHILEGTARHSESGLMKAHWSVEEIHLMQGHPMAFSGDDVDLIYNGIASRSTTLMARNY